MDWFLYDNGLGHETVKLIFCIYECLSDILFPCIFFAHSKFSHHSAVSQRISKTSRGKYHLE